MTGTQLRLLRVFALKLVTNTVEQLDVTLLRVLPQGTDKGPRHGTSRLASNGGICRGLVILATTPHDDISWRSLCAFVGFVAVIALGDLLKQAHSSASHAAKVTTSIAANNAQKTLAGFFCKVGLLEYTLRGVDAWKVQSRARVTRVEDSGQTHTGNEILDHDEVHLIINNVACLAEVDRVDDLVIAVFLVTVDIFCLTTVTWKSS